MGFCSCLGQYVLFLVNLGFALIGIALITVGAVYKYQFDQILEVLPNDVASLGLTPTLAIVVGCIVFVISFFGCCGAVKQGTCMLTTYTVLVFTILILQIAVGIYAFIQFGDNKTELKNEIYKQMDKSLQVYNKDNVIKDAFNLMQKELKCCGVYGPQDWDKISISTPSSCCGLDNGTCTSAITYREGCGPKLWSWLQDNVKIVGIVAIVVAAIELVGGIIAICQIRTINQRYHV